MKKTLTLILLLCSSQLIQAQEGLRLGLKGSYMSTWLFNKNVSDAGNELDYASTFGGTIGIQGVYMFAETYGINVEIVSAGHNQKYTGDDNGVTADLELKMRYIDIPVLFRVASEKGPYFEIGPQFSFLGSAKESATINDVKLYSDEDFKDNFNGFGLAAVLGFGVDIKLTDMVNLSTGLRFGYAFTDATKEFTQTEAAQKFGNDELSFVALSAHTNQQGAFDYAKTSRAFGGIQLGLQVNLSK